MGRPALRAVLLAAALVGFSTLAPAQVSFRRGDVNGDGSTDVADVVALLGHLFGGTVPGNVDCDQASDINGDDQVDISDPIRLLGYLFAGLSEPPAPFGQCGPAPASATLPCNSYPCGGTTPPSFLGSIVFVSQVPTDAGEFQISDLHGNFVGDNLLRDQPVGGNLYRLDPGNPVPVNLTNQTNAAVRNPELSWDAQRIIFSMKIGVLSKWQIYEIRTDGTQLTQITNTPHNETEPVYLPDGRIVFASDRLGLLDAYENFPTGQLFVMNPDGTNAQLLTTDPGGDVTPTIMESGEIAFTRWQATIKDPCRAQAEPIEFSPLDVSRFFLWKMTPDGDSDAHPIYGDHIIEDFRGGIAQSRPLRDGTGRFLTTIATAETFGAGAVAIIDPADIITATNTPTPLYLTPEGDYSLTEPGMVPPSGGRYRDPYPRASGDSVVSFAPGEVLNRSFDLPGAPIPDFGIYSLSANGTRTLLFNDPNMWEIEPIEIALRPVPPIIAPTLDLTQTTGILNTMDVTLRAQLPPDLPSPDLQAAAPVSQAAWVHLFKGVPSNFVYPDFHGYRQVKPGFLGRAPVLPDGSFAARIPADVPILWSLADAAGNTIIEERFWNQVRPGQTQTCAGCHSPKDGILGNTTNLALANPTDLSAFDPTRLIPGSPPAVASRAQWATDQPRELDDLGIPIAELFAVDGESRSDHDAFPGQVTFEVGVALNVPDPRFFGPSAPTLTDVAEIKLVSPSMLSPATPNELSEATALADALHAIGPSVSENGVPLRVGAPVTAHVQTALLPFVVAADTTRQLQFIAVDSSGVETTCTLDLRCESALPPSPPGEEREDPLYNAYRVQGGCDPLPFEDDFLVEYADLNVGGTLTGSGGFDVVVAGEDVCNVEWTLTQVAVLGSCGPCSQAYEFVRTGVTIETNDGNACATEAPSWVLGAEGTTVRWGWDANGDLWEETTSGWEIVGEVDDTGPVIVIDRYY